MADKQELKTEGYSPQLNRLLRLAEMEASRMDGRGVVVQVEHLMVAAMQDADENCALYELLTKCSMTITQLRTNDFTPKAIQTI